MLAKTGRAINLRPGATGTARSAHMENGELLQTAKAVLIRKEMLPALFVPTVHTITIAIPGLLASNVIRETKVRS